MFRYTVLFLPLLLSQVTYSQTLSDTLVHLRDVLQLAEQRYPLIKSKRLEVQASQKNTEVIKYTRVPAIDASYQANISTANNLTGQFYPYDILPMTGPGPQTISIHLQPVAPHLYYSIGRLQHLACVMQRSILPLP